ncbi:MAG: NADH-quinone oxidoreductase subunit N [Phycisphaerae bacterium]|nr:MAG: NADH-quinone oxidoreductase subunit N [Planctomycetia bacterium]RIK71418.1 MAG: NADH-quinone oxidoreductase subunit L [Planctomycetota bacterium]GJQ26543.1 MAG: NADH-quinone oxidoreductase subunit N [Phycisphaerae bacterium]
MTSLLAMHPLLMHLMPEVVLVCGASAILLLGLGSAQRGKTRSAELALLTLLGALWSAYVMEDNPPAPVSGLWESSLVWYARMVSIGVGVLILMVNRHVPRSEESAEFFALTLFSIAGISLVTVANDLMLLFLALELVSVPTYVLVGLSRRSIHSQEATGKYFFLGAFAAAITLYGFSFLYGAAGTMQLFSRSASQPCIASVLSDPTMASNKLVMLGLVLSLTGLAFKLAAVPLHFYVADVYQGAAAPVSGLLGFVPKFAGVLAIIRLLSLTGWVFDQKLYGLLWVMAAATMLVGNTLALMQHNVKRMLAYSSVAHSGYMLVGLVAGPGVGESVVASPLRNGLVAVLFYVAIYGVMNLGAFAALAFFRRRDEDADEDRSAESVEELSGAAREHPWASLCLALCVLGLMGFPLTAGFLGKLYIFSSAISAGAVTMRHDAMLGLVIFGVLNSAIAAAYYLRIIAVVYLGKPAEGGRVAGCHALKGALVLCAIAVVGLFVRPTILFEQSSRAAEDVHVAAPHTAEAVAERRLRIANSD